MRDHPNGKDRNPTPADEAKTILARINREYARHVPDAPEFHFLRRFFLGMYSDNDFNADDFAEYTFLGEDGTGAKEGDALTHAFFVACGYCVQAIRAEESGDSGAAWIAVLEATHWFGFSEGIDVGIEALEASSKAYAKSAASKAAQVKHSENRAMKADALKWYEENQHLFKSMDGAAEAIAGKVVPVKFRTAREWIGEWRRSLRSAGKP